MANPRELWSYFEDIDDGLVKCNRCGIQIVGRERIYKRMQHHLKHECMHRGEIPELNPPVPYRLRKYYTSSDGIATCKECGYKMNYTQSSTLFTHNNKCERSKWKRESQHEPSTSTTMATAMGSSAECQQLSFDSSSLQSRLHNPIPSTSTGYRGSSAGHQIQEQSISPRQESIDMNEVLKKIVRSLAKLYGQPVPSPEQTKKTPGAVDTPRTSASTVSNMGSAERKIQEQPSELEGLLSDVKRMDIAVKAVKAERSASGEYSPPVQSLEQTTKDPGAVDNSKTSSSKDYDVDTFVEPQTSERSVTNEQQLENLDKINRLLQSIQQSIVSVIKENSPSVPSPQPGSSTAEEYDMNPSERENDDRTRSEEQPDSQVLSSEQTTRNPGAVDTSTTLSSKDVDEFVHPQTPEVFKPATSEEHLANLNKIDKLVEETKETRRRDSTIPSPSVPSREYDRDSSERRSGEQPDSQVLSSEQTRKRKGAVDDNVADADTDDTRKRRKSDETDTDGDE